AAASGPQTTVRLVAMPEWMQCATGPGAQAKSAMKKRGGAGKGGGRPHGRKPPARVDVDESAVMTLRQVAEYLDCSYRTVFKLVSHGEIPGFRIGIDWRVRRVEVNQWIAKGGSLRK